MGDDQELAAYKKGFEAGVLAAGERVIDHCLRGNGRTAADFYTAVTGKEIVGVVVGHDGEVVCEDTAHLPPEESGG